MRPGFFYRIFEQSYIINDKPYAVISAAAKHTGKTKALNIHEQIEPERSNDIFHASKALQERP